MMSASPLPNTGPYTLSPQRTWVDTEPPRWAMPCTSLCLTSYPACMKPLDMIREIRMAP